MQLLFYLDYLKINAEILWLVSAKQHSTMDSGPAVTLPPLLARPIARLFLVFWGI